ncbi:MAG: hypothetical protein AB1758_38535, partial [Candidatus Eremiobacterota bacterium]
AERLPACNLGRLSSIALAGLTAAGTGPLGLAVAREALRSLHRTPDLSPARLGSRLLLQAPTGEVAEAVFREVALNYTLDSRAARPINDAELVLGLQPVRATPEQKLEAVTRALQRLSRTRDDLGVLEASQRGQGGVGPVGDRLAVGGVPVPRA